MQQESILDTRELEWQDDYFTSEDHVYFEFIAKQLEKQKEELMAKFDELISLIKEKEEVF